jgi:hypothetical protein
MVTVNGRVRTYTSNLNVSVLVWYIIEIRRERNIWIKHEMLFHFAKSASTTHGLLRFVASYIYQCPDFTRQLWQHETMAFGVQYTTPLNCFVRELASCFDISCRASGWRRFNYRCVRTGIAQLVYWLASGWTTEYLGWFSSKWHLSLRESDQTDCGAHSAFGAHSQRLNRPKKAAQHSWTSVPMLHKACNLRINVILRRKHCRHAKAVSITYFVTCLLP